MIRALVVEDSPVALDLLVRILESDRDIRVVGIARNGEEALDAAIALRPDVITMDIHMPVMDGCEATGRIMEACPTPIVIVSSSAGATELSSAFQAMEAGALAAVRRPHGIRHSAFEPDARELLLAVKLMSEIKVVRRSPRARACGGIDPTTALPRVFPSTGIQAVAIGASTGGPPVLAKILAGLPKDFAFPFLIVQHIAAGFVAGFADWLAGASGFPVRLARQGEPALPGHVYLAPDGYHLRVGRGPTIALCDDPPASDGLRPSVAQLFKSVERVLGPRAVTILLTGMGRDGAEEMKAMKDVGAITIAQDEESSTVHGMPGEAIRLGAATYVLPPARISALLAGLSARAKEESR